MKSENKADGRSVLFIDPAFQKSFLMYTVGSAIGISVFYFIAIAIFFSNFENKGLAMGLSPDHIFFRFLAEQRFTLDVVFVVTTIAMTAGLLIYGLYLSNRIAGPIHHVKKHLQDFRNGSVKGPINFREKDYFKALADEINQSLNLK